MIKLQPKYEYEALQFLLRKKKKAIKDYETTVKERFKNSINKMRRLKRVKKELEERIDKKYQELFISDDEC